MSTSSQVEDALDAMETQVLDLLHGKGEPTSMGETIMSAERLCGVFYSDPPPIDPSEGRRSSAELHALLDVLRGAPPTLPNDRTRAGYALVSEGARRGEPGVSPAFVKAFGEKNLRDAFPDLWAVDAALWERLDTATVQELARLWFESPGRRLVQDLRVIEHMPTGGRIGATDMSPARIDEAVGLQHVGAEDLPTTMRAHDELHASVPGDLFCVWQPKPEDEHQQVVRALHLLEEGSPLGLRGAALRWLLDRAADKPFYETAGVRRDLREDLSMRLATALDSWLGDDPTTDASRQLETFALQHAARFVANDTSENAPWRGWAIARWLQGCLRRSPFFGGDEEVLAAHLRARLATPPSIPDNADVLHPARFTLGEEGLDVAEVAFVAGIILHYQRAKERTLMPTPIPIVRALQRLADRDVRPAEEAAERALAEHNALGWPSEYAIIVPVAARRLMTELRIGWLGQVRETAQLDSIRRFVLNPKHHAWFASAVHREGQHLVSAARTSAAEAFRKLMTSDDVETHVLATFATGILGELSDNEAQSVIDLGARSDLVWRPFVVDAVAGSAERLRNDALWTRAIEQLIAWMEDVALDDKTRLNSALFAMRRVSASKASNRDSLLHRMAAFSNEQPFSTHMGLQTELRRLGLVKPNLTRSKR